MRRRTTRETAGAPAATPAGTLRRSLGVDTVEDASTSPRSRTREDAVDVDSRIIVGAL